MYILHIYLNCSRKSYLCIHCGNILYSVYISGNNHSNDLADSEQILSFNLTSKSQWKSRDKLASKNDNDYDDVEDSEIFIAIYDFTPNGPGQLTLTKGDRICVLEENGEWCEGKKESGDIGWIPRSYIAELNSLEKHSWYHGLVSREAAESRLSSEIDGSFLVRESMSRPGEYSISLKLEGSTTHYKIYQDGKYYYIKAGAKFKTLRSLVHHHSNHIDRLKTTLQYPAVNPTKPLTHSMSDKWEIERSNVKMGIKLYGGECSGVYKAVFKYTGKTVAVKTFKVCQLNFWIKFTLKTYSRVICCLAMKFVNHNLCNITMAWL